MPSIYMQSDNVITVSEVKNALTDAYINNATVTCTLKDSAGVNVLGQTWPLTLSYVSASNGVYKGTLEDGLTLVRGRYYVAHVDIDAGSDLIDHIEIGYTAAIKSG